MPVFYSLLNTPHLLASSPLTLFLVFNKPSMLSFILCCLPVLLILCVPVSIYPSPSIYFCHVPLFPSSMYYVFLLQDLFYITSLLLHFTFTVFYLFDLKMKSPHLEIASSSQCNPFVTPDCFTADNAVYCVFCVDDETQVVSVDERVVGQV